MVSELNFEDYLQKKFMEQEPQILDDDLPDAFDGWLANLDGADYIEYADKWMTEVKAELLEDVQKMGKILS